MLQKLLDAQERLQPHLLPGYYSFIGPANEDYFEPFMRTANNIAPVDVFNNSIHHVLSNKQAVGKALSILPSNEPLRIYVVNNNYEDKVIHDTVEGYCQQHGIDFTP